MSIITEHLPITRYKIAIARLLYKIITFFIRKNNFVIARKGIQFEVDLREGIDLSLYLLGNFQDHIYHNRWLDIQKDDVIIDVGANFGIMSLNYAAQVPNGRIYAFEPTHYALQRFRRNLSLNPDLASRIAVFQHFVSENPGEIAAAPAYSSWKVDGSDTTGKQVHSVHLGEMMSTEGVSTISIDTFIEEHSIHRLNHIKIDTDGHEPDVLKGSLNTLKTLRPKVIFEIGRYVMEERRVSFSDYIELFEKVNYTLIHSVTGKQVDVSNYKTMIPKYGTIDLIALPN
jgi:FkbM family methyltransferase